MCKYAHSEDEIGQLVGSVAGIQETEICFIHDKKRSSSALMLNEEGQMVCMPGRECKGLSEPGTTPCRFFAQGTCTKGDACPFVHEVAEEVAQDLVQPAKKLRPRG